MVYEEGKVVHRSTVYINDARKSETISAPPWPRLPRLGVARLRARVCVCVCACLAWMAMAVGQGGDIQEEEVLGGYY